MNHPCKFSSLLITPLPIRCLLVVCLLLLSGCSKQPSDTYHTYVARLANTLEQQPPRSLPLQQLRLTSPVAIEEPSDTLSILQLASLSHCQLGGLISERNNQLGKTATAASTFKYQVEFIQSAAQCLQTLNSTSTIYNTIASATAYKQRYLMHYFNSMLFKEPELNQTWQLTSRELSTAAAGYSDTLAAMTTLVAIKQHIAAQQFSAIDTHALFNALEQLNKYRFNQLLIQSARTQIALNDRASQFLRSVDIATLCPKGKSNQSAQILSNIFKKFYLADIQPYQAQLTGYLETLQPLYTELWFKQPISSEPINTLLAFEQNSNLLKQLKSSAKNHVVWWQTFYKTCEISPI